MSILAFGVKHNVISISADSQVTASDEIVIDYVGKKIWKQKGMIIASCGSCEETSMLHMYIASNKVPKETTKEVFTYMALFYNARDKNNSELKGDGDLSKNIYVIALKGKLFAINSLHVNEFKNGQYHAFGAGWQLAIGAMDAGSTTKEAATIVCNRDIYCGLPVITYTMPYRR